MIPWISDSVIWAGMGTDVDRFGIERDPNRVDRDHNHKGRIQSGLGDELAVSGSSISRLIVRIRASWGRGTIVLGDECRRDNPTSRAGIACLCDEA